MVEFDHSQGRFNYRVAGVAVHNGRVLLDRNTRNNYWVLPGGHPELMEPMAVALQREIEEEIGSKVVVGDLLWVVENFFQRSKPIHELSFYFSVKMDESSPLLKSDGPFYGTEHTHTLIYQWYPLDEKILSSLPLYPSFLSSALTAIPAATQHIVFEEIVRRPSGTRSEITSVVVDSGKNMSIFPSQ